MQLGSLVAPVPIVQLFPEPQEKPAESNQDNEGTAGDGELPIPFRGSLEPSPDRLHDRLKPERSPYRLCHAEHHEGHQREGQERHRNLPDHAPGDHPAKFLDLLPRLPHLQVNPGPGITELGAAPFQLREHGSACLRECCLRRLLMNLELLFKSWHKMASQLFMVDDHTAFPTHFISQPRVRRLQHRDPVPHLQHQSMGGHVRHCDR